MIEIVLVLVHNVLNFSLVVQELELGEDVIVFVFIKVVGMFQLFYCLFVEEKWPYFYSFYEM